MFQKKIVFLHPFSNPLEMKKRHLFIASILALVAIPLATSCGKDEPADPIKEILDGFNEKGASLAKFSISMYDQVRFSRGNLQYQASTGKWRFAPHQYDYIGTANNSISPSNSGWIDLYGWGTSGWDSSGAAAYRPFDTSIISTRYGSGTSHLNGAKAKADWAYRNPIQYGGDTTRYWRTLSAAEWRFLLTGRKNAIMKFGIATVNNVKGLVLLPDEWVVPDGVSFIAGISDTVDFDYEYKNKFSATEWTSMETAGAIFLPAAGCRTAMKTVDVDRYGYYWSSTSGTVDSMAQNLVFSTKKIIPDHLSNRHFGFCVRPVVDVR